MPVAANGLGSTSFELVRRWRNTSYELEQLRHLSVGISEFHLDRCRFPDSEVAKS